MKKQVVERQAISLLEILDVLGRGVTVITGNNRLAGATRLAFDRAAMDQGLEVWPTPKILPWSAWVHTVWEEAVISGCLSSPERLLTSQQEQRVWADIIAESLAEQPLLQVEGTVCEVQGAWQLLQSWQLPLDNAAFRYNSDSAAFSLWAATFEAKCAKQGWLSSASLPEELQRGVRTGNLSVPSELLLLGFDELTPQQQSLLQTLAEAGCTVHWGQLAERPSQTARIACLDARQEAATMARWVRQRLDENPGAQIGIVVPELAAQRDMLMHALDQFLVPSALLPGRQSMVRPYTISLGPPLSACPIVQTALRLLGLLVPPIRLDDVSSLLRTPFLAAWQQEATARALLDGRLRKTGELHVSLRTLSYHASQTEQSYACPVLAENLAAWVRAARDCPRKESLGQWSERFAGLLKIIGWASGRPLSSAEYQATEAWRELLGTFAALEQVTKPMTLAAAVAQLRRMADERTFQPQTGIVPVQVLGMLETNGLQFDHLWMMQLHDGAWPVSPRPNPFIPLPMQRDAGLPHSSELRELQVSRTMTRRMLTSASEVIVSFPQRDGDEALRPSPLIADLPVVSPEALRLWLASTWQEDIHHSASLTTVEEVPVPLQENTEVSGGSAVFKLQAACSFRAFAELRLGAQALRQVDIGLDAMTRGSLMHRVLEKVWQALDSHGALVNMEAGQLNTLVEARVAEAIDEMASRHPQTLAGRFRVLEAKRLGRQVLEWLELEKQRVVFRVVEAEKKHEVTAGGVRVHLKIDRIDRLDDGRQLVIDYKTGEVKPAQWFGERPDEPQLPLYSMAVGEAIAGVLFAQVRAGGMAFKGVAESEGLAPKVKSYARLSQTRDASSWPEVLRNWRTTIEGLGEGFRRGDASVDPKQYPQTCTYCELKPLCRIHELTALHSESTGMEDQG